VLSWQDAQAMMETIMRIDFKVDQVLGILREDGGEDEEADA
jgi:hypothetical protein